jgi:hypothetical protein
MNECIKELAVRLWKIHPSEIDEMGLKTRTEFYEHELKKFAELIVKECAKVADDRYDNGFCPVGSFIKEHLGVK